MVSPAKNLLVLVLTMREQSNHFFNSVSCDEPDDLDGPCLSNTVRTCGSLQIVLRVEVAVEENDSVGAIKIEPGTPSLGAGVSAMM